MKIRVDDRFSRQVEATDLRFRCVDCFHYLPSTGGCAHFWPNEEHNAPLPEEPTDLAFCKEFELG